MPDHLDPLFHEGCLKPGIGQIGHVLDAQDIAACFIDSADIIRAWNKTYLVLFPEHEGRIFDGERYLDNLRRYFHANFADLEDEAREFHIATAFERHLKQAEPSHFQRRDGRFLISRVLRYADGSALKTWIDRSEDFSGAPLLLQTAGPSGVTIYDSRGQLAGVNQQMARLFPGDSELMRSNPYYPAHAVALADLLADPEDAERIRAKATRAWPIAASWRESLVVHMKDGRWMRVDESTRYDGGLIVAWTDITDNRQVEDNLRREQELALMQRSFVEMASHQFKTPLTIIDANAQMLRPRGNLPIPRQTLDTRVDRIRRAVRRLVQLIDLMLGAASAEAGTIDLKPSPQDPAKLLNDMRERMRDVAPQRIFDLDLADLPPSIVCDANLVEQVFANLFSNAIKYAPTSTPIDVVGRIDGADIVVTVRDYGPGIPPEEQAQVFERFFRGRAASHVPGTGIGLTLARYVVDLHGGQISVESAPGEGAAFSVRLPINGPSEPPAPPPPAPLP